MRISGLASTAIVIASVYATGPLTPDKVEADIVTTELQRNLWNLNKIGRENGGNRAFGLPGYNASLDFILERVQKRFAKEIDTTVQGFTTTFEQTREIRVTGPEGENVYVITMLYNNPTPVPDGVTAPLIDTPVDDANGSACVEEQWAGIDATGKIALIKRGVCAIADKLRLAAEHGAIGAIIYNQNPGTTYGSATLSKENFGVGVPGGIVPLEVGTDWKLRLAAGEELVVSLLVDSLFDERETWNIIAETKEGDPDSVIMLGAHLDSVQAGPGINDDGSGVTALLEILGSIKKYKGFPNKVRFAFWAAEESGLVGSNYYTSTLSEGEANKIKYYFNYDMIGSPKPEWGVFDKESSGVGSKLLYDYIVSQGEPAFYASFGDSSDYVGFNELGIPASGIHTGGGGDIDPCYHLACDTIDNVNWEALTINARAAGRAAAALALSLDGIPTRETVSPNPKYLRGRERMTYQFRRWAAISKHAEEGHVCASSSRNIF